MKEPTCVSEFLLACPQNPGLTFQAKDRDRSCLEHTGSFMTKTVLLATAAVLALSVGGASAAGVSVSTKGMHAKAHKIDRVKANHANAVLYDQHGTDSGIGIVSQNFESSFDAYDSQAADDFVVPAGHRWRVREVDASGVYFNGSGPATSETVTFYKDKNGHPGKVVGTDTVTGTDSFGSFAISLSKNGSPILRGGKKGAGKTYWVSVVANLDFFAGGEWGWENQTTVVHNPAQWQNPGGGFGVCSSWDDENVCIPDGQGDHMFTIRGGDHG